MHSNKYNNLILLLHIAKKCEYKYTGHAHLRIAAQLDINRAIKNN